jgi:hypothetical protein
MLLNFGDRTRTGVLTWYGRLRDEHCTQKQKRNRTENDDKQEPEPEPETFGPLNRNPNRYPALREFETGTGTRTKTGNRIVTHFGYSFGYYTSLRHIFTFKTIKITAGSVHFGPNIRLFFLSPNFHLTCLIDKASKGALQRCTNSTLAMRENKRRMRNKRFSCQRHVVFPSGHPSKY